MEPNLEEKYHNLKKNLSDMGSALLSFSGGVDSTLLLALCKEALGDNCIAVTIHSPLHPLPMLEGAAAAATRIDVEHITVETDELENETFCSNPPERCYLCKHERFSKLIEVAAREGMAEVIDGTQLDDTDDYRPGTEAATELGVRSPLLETGFQKYEVRDLSRELGLSTWNYPSSTCLATRIPYSKRITGEKLSVIESGERFLTDLGLSQVRLRYVEDRTARIEVSLSSIPSLVSDSTRQKVLDKMRDLGFLYVTMDLGGYRTGAMNEALLEA
jgi:pyridinium-3,5-biscarboxylic acid mononucleotide sulfurtransferase